MTAITARCIDPAATPPSRLVSTKTPLPAGSLRTSTTDFCARPAKDFSAWTDAGSLRNIASPILLTARTHRHATTRNGRGNCSSTPRAGHRGKNRNPSYGVGHPVLPRRTYGRPPARVPYVLRRRTYTRPRGVLPRRTYLDCHPLLQGRHRYRVAQQLERQRKLEVPVRARPLLPTSPNTS